MPVDIGVLSLPHICIRNPELGLVDFRWYNDDPCLCVGRLHFSEDYSAGVSAMKDIIWIFRDFGFWAGAHYCWDSLVVKVSRLISRKPTPKLFEELSDKEARQVAWAFGIYKWNSRQDLNDQWNVFESHTLH